jgi:hypothetical protein
MTSPPVKIRLNQTAPATVRLSVFASVRTSSLVLTGRITVPTVIFILIVYLLGYMAANPAMPHGMLWFAG